MKKFTARELKEKTKGEVNDDLRKLFAMQYDMETHNKLRHKTENHTLEEGELRNRYEIIFKHFQDYCSEGKHSMMVSRFGQEPESGQKRDLWLKKRNELALFMIRVYSGIEDREELVSEVAEWINKTKEEFVKNIK